MKPRILLFILLASLLTIHSLTLQAVAENDIGPHDEGDLDGDVDVDMSDVDLLGLFVGGHEEPEQWQFWRGDIYPYTLNGSDLCPQGDGVLCVIRPKLSTKSGRSCPLSPVQAVH